jgi:tetratricopeptide (TPR) repeat protein
MLAPAARAATNDLTTTLQRGLFEEEANQNLGAAIQAYQAVASQFDKDRKLAATAIFRLGECYRKQGNTNDAAAQYERILREFSDQPTLVTLSRQNLAGISSAPRTTAAPAVLSEAARQEQKRLLGEEIKAVQAQLDWEQQQVQAGVCTANKVVTTERELLQLKRWLASLDAGQPISLASAETDAQAARPAEAESLSLEAQLAAFKVLPKDKMRRELLQSRPNAALQELMSWLGSEESKLAALTQTYTLEHPLVTQEKARVESLNQKIDAHVEAALKGLELERDVASSAARRLQALLAAAASQGRSDSPGGSSSLGRRPSGAETPAGGGDQTGPETLGRAAKANAGRPTR